MPWCSASVRFRHLPCSPSPFRSFGFTQSSPHPAALSAPCSFVLVDSLTGFITNDQNLKMTLFTKGEKGDLTTQIFQIFSGKEVRVWVVASGNLAGLRATPLHPLTIPPHRDSEITGSSEPLSYTFQYFHGRCSVSKLYPTPCDPMDCSTPGFSVLHCLLEFPQTHVH